MQVSTKDQQKPYEKIKKPTISIKKGEDKHAKDKKYLKVRDHCHYTGEQRRIVHSACNLKYSLHKEIPIIFHIGSNCDYHFTIKQLAEESEKQFTCLGKNTKIYITFSDSSYKNG